MADNQVVVTRSNGLVQCVVNVQPGNDTLKPLLGKAMAGIGISVPGDGQNKQRYPHITIIGGCNYNRQ